MDSNSRSSVRYSHYSWQEDTKDETNAQRSQTILPLQLCRVDWMEIKRWCFFLSANFPYRCGQTIQFPFHPIFWWSRNVSGSLDCLVLFIEGWLCFGHSSRNESDRRKVTTDLPWGFLVSTKKSNLSWPLVWWLHLPISNFSKVAKSWGTSWLL